MKAKGSLKNNFTFNTPMHPAWLRCENSEYPDIPPFSRLANRAPQRLKLRTYFFVNPKRLLIKTATFVILFLLTVACNQGNKEQLPVDFVWDRVACEECNMALSDPHYSAQVIDSNGRAYFFDDIGCAFLWLRRQPWKDKARTWVNDVKTTEWIEAKNANWIYGNPRTPMGYGFAATLSPVENALDYETVKKWMVIGKTLVNENLTKHLGSSNKQPSVKKQPFFSSGKKTDNQIPLKVKGDRKTE